MTFYRIAVVSTMLVGCTPSPEKVCGRIDDFDKADPMPNYRFSGPSRPRASKVASCERQLRELKAVDEKAYGACARCVMRAKTSTDAWDCWVLDHISTTQPAKKEKLLACDNACTAAQETCFASCKTESECRTKCHAAFEDCAASCQFD
jgi:hypothetical protein